MSDMQFFGIMVVLSIIVSDTSASRGQKVLGLAWSLGSLFWCVLLIVSVVKSRY